MNNKALSLLKVITPCDCTWCYCYSFSTQEPIVYRILGSKYTARKLVGITTYWLGCPRHIDATPSCFEEIFENIGEDDKLTLIYHLNYFREGRGEI